MNDDSAVCETHGYVTVVDQDSFSGHAGGRCYVTTLSCGCVDLDESADVAAAY
jgi:hypothetical protein